MHNVDSDIVCLLMASWINVGRRMWCEWWRQRRRSILRYPWRDAIILWRLWLSAQNWVSCNMLDKSPRSSKIMPNIDVLYMRPSFLSRGAEVSQQSNAVSKKPVLGLVIFLLQDPTSCMEQSSPQKAWPRTSKHATEVWWLSCNDDGGSCNLL